MRYVVLIILLITASLASAQSALTGFVVEHGSGEPLTGASVMIKSPDGKVISHTITGPDGTFSLHAATADSSRFEVSMLSYVTVSLPLNNISFPATISLQPTTILIEDVTVRADRIRRHADTIAYDVAGFAQVQDGSIGDVLSRMPGISIDGSGCIQYQGIDINRLYIDGADLLGGKYGIATNNIGHSDVATVEVLEHHQPVQVLSGIYYSEQPAINLRLKDKAKAVWNASASIAGGYCHQPTGGLWKDELSAMTFMPRFQSITTLKTNNTGDELTTHSTDFFALRRTTYLRRYVGLSLPAVPSLSKDYTLFNRSLLFSTNGLWKLGRGEIKAQIDYAFNRVVADASTFTTYFLNTTDRIVTEHRSGISRMHSLAARIIYELNEKSLYIHNTLKTNLDWDHTTLHVSGTLTNFQSASLPDFYISDDFKLIHRIGKGHLITFISRNEWESMPQSLYTTVSNEHCRQRVRDHALHTDQTVAYSFALRDITVGLEGGIKGYLRSLNTYLTGVPALPDEEPSFTNDVATDYFTLYITPKAEYRFRRVNLSLQLPLRYTRYSFHRAQSDRSEVYFTPTLSLNWQPSAYFTAGLHGGAGRSPMELSMIQPAYVMTNYRSFRRGVDRFYTYNSQNASANVAFKHPHHGIFANALVSHSWIRKPYTLAQQLYGDYVLYSYAPARSHSRQLFATATAGKTLGFMRGSASLTGSFNRSESHLLSQTQAVRSVNRTWTVSAKINGTPVNWLSLDYSIGYTTSRLLVSGTDASWLSSVQNALTLHFTPHPRWQCELSGEHFLNELSADTYKQILLVDASVSCQVHRHIGLALSLSNIFNHRTYYYKTFNQLSSFESLRWLRGRELLLTLSLSL